MIFDEFYETEKMKNNGNWRSGIFPDRTIFTRFAMGIIVSSFNV